MPNIAYLGPPNDHWISLDLVFRGAGVRLIQILDSLAWSSASPAAGSVWLARARRVWWQIAGTADAQYLQHALRLIDELDVTCVLAFWGTRPLADIRALKRLRPHLRVVLVVLCHPLGLTPLKARMEHLLLNHAMRELDGLIVSSHVMERYLAAHVPASRRVTKLLLAPCWAETYARHAPLTPLAEQPNVIFLGRMDWRAGQSTDNVTGPLRELMREGIDVHFSRSPESEIVQEHACTFEAVDIKQLGDFASRFDASLILYELAHAKVTDRFDVTVPDRLITSVAAGIPIALPAEGFAACKEYLQAYGAVLEFRSMAHLAEQLRDRVRMGSLRKLAWERSRLYRAEAELPKLMRFLRQVQPDLETVAVG